MAGMFDDLIPQQRTAVPRSAPAPGAAPAAGMFDDLIPQQRAASPSPSVTADIAKSAGTGVVKGGIGMLSSPGDVFDLAGNAFEYGGQRLAKWAGATPENFQPQSFAEIAADNRYLRTGGPTDAPADTIGGKVLRALDRPILPRAGEVNAAVQKVAGPYHEPQTAGGRYAQAVGEFLPGMAIGPGGLVRKAVGDVVLPAVASETAGNAVAGSQYEPYARFAGALGGNMASAGVRYVGNVPARAVTHALGETTPAQLDAARDVQATGARVGVPLSGPEAIQYATGGATKLGDLLRFTEGTQRGGAVTAPFFARRPDQISAAGNAALDAIAPASTTPSMLGPQVSQLAERSIDEVRQGINTATRPAYAAAEQHIVPQADFDPIARNPAFQASLQRLREDPVLGPQYAHMPDNSGAVIDAVSKDMHARSQALGSVANPGFQPQTAAAYASGAGDARDILRDPARGGTQHYDDALTMQEQARRQNLEPLEQGPLGRVRDAGTTQAAYDALLPSKPLTGSQYDVGRAVGALVHQDPVVAATLVRQGLADKFDQATMRLMSGPNQAGGAKYAKEIAGTPQQRQNLDAVFGALPNGAPAQASLNDVLDAFQATGYRKALGSNTTADTAVGRELAMAPAWAEAAKAPFTVGTTVPRAIAERSHNLWLNRRAGALGDMFIAPDSVDRIAAISARADEAPFFAAGARSSLVPSMGALYAGRDAR